MSSGNNRTADLDVAGGLGQLDEALRLLEEERQTVIEPNESLLAALFDLVQRVLSASSTATACRVVADGLKRLASCETTAVAVVRRGEWRIEAVSQVDKFDRNAGRIAHYETVCRRFVQSENILPSQDSYTVQIDGCICLALSGDDELPAAVCLVEGGDGATSSDLDRTLELFADSMGQPLAVRLAALQGATRRRRLERLCHAVRTNRRMAWLAAILLTAGAFLPVPYQVRCDCELQPVVRRHVVVPFDGVLEKSFAKPGDIVEAGQLLARLDSKELTWEAASATADRDRAEKSRDVNLSSGKTAASQIDRFEARRLDERRKLLENRLAHLDVKSPIAGVVVSGDLDRAEGAPVKLGRSLFEVAPLDKMIVEVLIPEADVDHVRVGQEVAVSLDSVPGTKLLGQLTRLHPRAEIRREENVFVAEVTLANDDGELRPGMKGRAAVRTDRQPLIWIASHRLLESVSRWLW